MIPNSYGARVPTFDAPTVKKRRSRKKKPAVVDPEAERQEQELRMKIKQSLHTQQVLRTEVEEDEAQKNAKNVANSAGSIVGQANMGNNQMNMMMGGMSPMGYSGMQSQMGGMGSVQQQQQYQYNTQNQQQYGYPQDQGNPGMGGTNNIPIMQQQMQQMKQQLEIQRQQLEQQLQMKHRLELQQIVQQEQQSPAYFQSNRSQDMGKVKMSSEEIMRSLKYEQERLLNEAQKRGDMNSIGNNMNGQPQSSSSTPVPQCYMTAQYQQHEQERLMREAQKSGNVGSTPPPQYMDNTGNSMNSPAPSANTTPAPQYMENTGNNMNSPAPSANTTPPPQYMNNNGNNMNSPVPLCNTIQPPPYNMPAQYQQGSSYNRSPLSSRVNGDMMTQGNYTNQDQSQGQQQYPSPQPYSGQQGTALNEEQINERYIQLMGQSEQKSSTEPQSLEPQPNGRYTQPLDGNGRRPSRRSQGTQESAESWLKAGSMNSTNSSFSSGMAFHSIGNMSGSFTSIISAMDGGMENALGLGSSERPEQQQVPNAVVVEDQGSPGERGSGNNLEQKKSTEEGGSEVISRVPSRRSDKGYDNEAINNASVNKGAAYKDTTVALQPIQENEADESSHAEDRFAKSSLMMSVMEDDFMQSNLSANGHANSMTMNDLMMSMDSTAFHALMKQSQNGTSMNLSNFSMSDLIDSASTLNQQAMEAKEPSPPSSAPPSGGGPDKRGKQVDSPSSGNVLNQTFTQSSQLKNDSGSSMLPVVSMDDNRNFNQSNRRESSTSTKRMSSNSKQDSVRSRKSGSTMSKVSMMSEISQWTQNNPFDEANSPGGGEGGEGASNTRQHQQQQGDDHDFNFQKESPVDMGDFHSLGGSIANSLDISMMSSMTGGEGLTESLRNLDISTRSSGKEAGKRNGNGGWC